MVKTELLDLLRCPVDPTHTARLEQAEGGLACQRCRVLFAVREGIPSLVPEDATLPEGCKSLNDLPCKQRPKPEGGSS
jgi:uncharacterized protein YbaR (Trm112 family)